MHVDVSCKSLTLVMHSDHTKGSCVCDLNLFSHSSQYFTPPTNAPAPPSGHFQALLRGELMSQWAVHRCL